MFSFSSLAGTQSRHAYEVLLRSRKGGGGARTVLAPGVKDSELKPVTLRKTIVRPSGKGLALPISCQVSHLGSRPSISKQTSFQ